MRRLSSTILFCFLAACHRQPQAYTLARQGRSQVLTPPPSKPEIKNARNRPAKKNGCDIEAGSFTLTWHGNTALVSAKTETYYAPPVESQQQSTNPAITIAATSVPAVYAEPLAQLESFREAVAAREDSGCFNDAESSRLRQSIAETFPFPPQIIAYLRYGTYARTGYLDLIPGFVMRVVTPSSTTPDLSFYTITKAKSGERVRIALTSGPGKALTVQETPAYYRYLFWTGASEHNFRTTILGAPDRQTLHDATAQFFTDPEKYCEKPEAAVFCQSIAVTVGMNIGFNVRVDGREAFVRMGGSVSEAVRENPGGLIAIGPRQPVHVQSVRRLFRGKPIPINFEGNEILSLVLLPGDEITTSLQ